MNQQTYLALVARLDAAEQLLREQAERIATLERILASATRAKGSKEAA